MEDASNSAIAIYTLADFLITSPSRSRLTLSDLTLSVTGVKFLLKWLDLILVKIMSALQIDCP